MIDPTEATDTEAARALNEACPGIHILSSREISSGYTARQWLFDTDEGLLVVKAPVRLRDPEHSRNMIVATRLAAEAGLPVVRFRAFVPQSTVFDGPTIVQEFVEGEPADQAWPGLDERTRLEVMTDLGARVGALHSVTSEGFGDVLGHRRTARWDKYLAGFLEQHMREAPEDIIPAGRSALEKTMAAAIGSVVEARPGLVHGDLWLSNFLLRDHELSCVLDFEHGQFLDPLYEFGKPDELMFEGWPAGRSAFMAGYRSVRPAELDAENRVLIYRGFHYLFMFTWFARWQPEHLPEYRTRLSGWRDDLREASL